MKLAPEVVDALGFLEVEFEGRGETPYIPYYSTSGIDFQTVADMLGAKASSGANCQSLIFDSHVIKWSCSAPLIGHDSDSHANEALTESARGLNPWAQKHLAKTSRYGIFTIQERIYPINVFEHHVSSEKYIDCAKTVALVGMALGLSDLHTGNWGFRVNPMQGGSYNEALVREPVIFDFSGRHDYFSPKKRDNSAARVLGHLNLSRHTAEESAQIVSFIENVIEDIQLAPKNCKFYV